MSSQSISLYNQLAKNRLFKKRINFDLSRIKKVLKNFNNPERKLSSVINVIGSDGKFSLLTCLKYFIEENGQSVSTFISPSLKDIKERFWIKNRFLSHKEIKETIKIIQKQKIPLTTFEVLTVIYILNSSRISSDYNLIEAGALFAKDSTNLFDFPKLQAIVNINKQHLNFVKKKTIQEIIRQKVGFLSNYTDIYVGKQKPENKKIIKKILKKNKSNKFYYSRWKLIKRNKEYLYKDNLQTINLKNKFINSDGLYQNLCMAIKIALDLGISKKKIESAIPKIRITGRLEYITKGGIAKKLFKNEKLLIDGCHSAVSAENFANYLKFQKAPKIGIFGMLKNKNPEEFIKKIKNIFDKVYIIPIDGQRNFISPKYLKNICVKNGIKSEIAKNVLHAINKISSKQKKIICLFGSLYLCGELLKIN